MFGNADMKELVLRAGKALEDEHRHLTKCSDVWRRRERSFGICYNPNERYYQFVIWRELMKGFRWRPATEREFYDLAFYDDVTNNLVAVAEMKCWWSNSGEVELPGIKRDMEKILAIKKDVKESFGILSIPGVMLIFTVQSKAPSKKDKNLLWLASRLEVDRDCLETYGFEIEPHAGFNQEGSEFTVIGFLVQPKVAAAKA